jgi:hypothetical protein
MADPTKLRLAPAEVLYDGTSLGYLAFDTPVEIEDDSKGVDLKAAQTGDTPLDTVMTGHSCTVKVPVVEVTPDKLSMAVPNSRVTGGTVTVTLKTGLSLRSIAKELIIKRVVAGVPSDDPDDVFTFPLASPAPGRVTHQFNANKQEEFAITFKIWPDPLTGDFYSTGA